MMPEQRGVIAWFAANPVAANLLMVMVIVLGLFSFNGLQKEAFPSREADTVTVSVTYSSGDASLSEEGIAVKVEEALSDVLGIKRVTSTSNANGATISIEKKSDHDLDILLRDVKAKVDAIYSFPTDAEKPVIAAQRRLNHAYSIKIYGGDDRAALQRLAERVKADLLAQSGISNVTIKGKAEGMISIELDEAKLQAYGLTFTDIANKVNQESRTGISTSLRNANKVIRLKVAEQAYYVNEFGQIPLVTTTSGSIIRLRDIATVTDTFADNVFVLSRYNGEMGIGLEVKVDESGDVLNIVEQADAVVKSWQSNSLLPANVQIDAWDDGGVLIRDRLALLVKNALSGIALVFLVLALFLNLRVAIWVTAGLPFIFCGTLFFMTEQFTGMTINEMTTFGFILALGIVVDDAVVVGESIYSTRKKDGDSLASTIRGTHKVAVPTVFGVLTTVAVFVGLANVAGGMGEVYSQFAVIVTICLLLSLVESKLILPSHLAHLNTHRVPKSGWRNLWPIIQHKADSGLNWFNDSVYRPVIERALGYRYALVFGFITLFILVLGMPSSGVVRVGFFPDIPGSTVDANFTMQNDASFGQTHINLLKLEQAAIATDKALSQHSGYQGKGINTLELIASGDLTASAVVELSQDAPYGLNDFVRAWRQQVGQLEGVKKLNIKTGFGGTDNFKVELKSWDSESLTLAGKAIKEYIQPISGVSGIDDNFDSGQAQLKFELNEQGYAYGLTTQSLSRQLLQGFGGEVVQRFQRGKDEIKVRIRYPAAARQSPEDVLGSRVRLDNGAIVPLSSVADVTAEYQQNEMTRISGLPAVYVSATVDKQSLSPNELVAKIKQDLVPKLKASYPSLQIHFAGEAEQQAETAGSMVKLFALSMAAIYILLAIPLKSYIQPLIIMTAIPFGVVGAILGHWYNDMLLSILSFNGIVALSGVVVNDSLLLVSTFNDLRTKGEKVQRAIVEACTGRLRAVLLTSITTYAGLMPLLGETSAQAQFIIPAAASLGYGILFATVITLLLIPALLLIIEDIKAVIARLLAFNQRAYQ